MLREYIWKYSTQTTDLNQNQQYTRFPVSEVRFVAVLKSQGPRFDPGLANYVYRTMLAIITLVVDARINTNVQNVRKKLRVVTWKYRIRDQVYFPKRDHRYKDNPQTTAKLCQHNAS